MLLDESISMDAEEVTKRLATKGIGTRPFFYPMHQQPVLKNIGLFEGVNLPIAEHLYRRGFYIPSGMALTDKQMNHVAESVKEILL